MPRNTPEITGTPVLWRHGQGNTFASMNMIIAAMNGELRPSAKTETICRVSLIVSLVTFLVLMASTFMEN